MRRAARFRSRTGCASPRSYCRHGGSTDIDHVCTAESFEAPVVLRTKRHSRGRLWRECYMWAPAGADAQT
jgi:hypothetical protein